MDLNSCQKVVKDDDNELKFREKCFIDVTGAQSTLDFFAWKDLTEMKKWLFPVLAEKVISN